MAGIEDPGTVDLVTHDPATDEYALIMIETRPWQNSPEQLAQLREKINNYAMLALDEGLLQSFPEAADKPLRLQLDCVEPPTGEAAEVVALAAERLSEHHIRFLINVSWSDQVGGPVVCTSFPE
jgi:hypothetical protein